MSIDGKLAQANGRLKAGKVGVAIEVRGDRLCLRAVFPPKPESLKVAPYQQRLSLHFHANPTGLKLAEQEARRIGSLLDSGKFDWHEFAKNNVQNSCADWITKYEQDYFARRPRNPQTETTWKSDYLKVLGELPPAQSLSVELCDRLIRTKAPDTRTRKRFVDVLTRFCLFAGLEPNFKPLKGQYSPKKVVPRTLPNDSQITQLRFTIPNPEWQRAYSLIAVYGLRPHEVFLCNLDRFPLCEVAEGTKTGSRLIYPFYPEWAEAWDLKGTLPTVTGRDNTALGQRVTHAFSRYGLPWPPYNLRHCWAVRSLEFGLDVSLAAAQMGHSVKVHCEIYHAWITDDVHARAYQILMSNPNRPQPPMA